LEAYGVSVHAIKADLSSVSEVERLGKEAIEWSPTGGIDILVSNAATGKMKDWMDVRSKLKRVLMAGYC
jgi:NAD(P)-dependent dehydrogenase (short-subunit alcohol dehydrogenase family)